MIWQNVLYERESGGCGDLPAAQSPALPCNFCALFLMSMSALFLSEAGKNGASSGSFPLSAPKANSMRFIAIPKAHCRYAKQMAVSSAIFIMSLKLV